jgi:hypothetical protein
MRDTKKICTHARAHAFSDAVIATGGGRDFAEPSLDTASGAPYGRVGPPEKAAPGPATSLAGMEYPQKRMSDGRVQSRAPPP